LSQFGFDAVYKEYNWMVYFSADLWLCAYRPKCNSKEWMEL